MGQGQRLSEKEQAQFEKAAVAAAKAHRKEGGATVHEIKQALPRGTSEYRVTELITGLREAGKLQKMCGGRYTRYAVA